MEVWKSVEGYKGTYEVSNYGNVRSKLHKVNTKGGSQRNSPGRMLKQKIARNGYKLVPLSKDGKEYWIGVHRLVAIAFLPNPDHLSQVNHKDEDKTNNIVDNLEWCTPSYNCKYGHRNDTMIEQRRKAINAYKCDTLIYSFKSIHDASRATGISAGHICQCCKGQRNLAGGYKWRYA